MKGTTHTHILFYKTCSVVGREGFKEGERQLETQEPSPAPSVFGLRGQRAREAEGPDPLFQPLPLTVPF